ncbi:MAG: hypothetical protein R2838_15795 [Caldilineaceae bacterium]
MPIAADLTAQSFDVDLGTLPGSNQFRVGASDGINTTYAASVIWKSASWATQTITVTGKTPTASDSHCHGPDRRRQRADSGGHGLRSGRTGCCRRTIWSGGRAVTATWAQAVGRAARLSPGGTITLTVEDDGNTATRRHHRPGRRPDAADLPAVGAGPIAQPACRGAGLAPCPSGDREGRALRVR